MQPIVRAPDGVVRFRENAIVRYLLDHGGLDMNQIAAIAHGRGPVPAFTKEDQSQFAQLIGYSVSGFGELNYADPDEVAEADRLAAGVLP